jgi:hypothetical protein
MEANSTLSTSLPAGGVSEKRFLWVFGNAVQDITVEVDIERLSRELGSLNEIRLEDTGPEITAGLWLRTQVGSQEFAVSVKLQGQEMPEKRYRLEGGGKYTLAGDIVESPQGLPERSLFLPCENLSWGGGGANVVTFLRALAPRPEVVPIKYTDIAMSRSLPILFKNFEAVRRRVIALPTKYQGKDNLERAIRDLYESDPVQAEAITSEIAKIASGYAPERSLEVYLASLPVEGVLYRPKVPRFRRNLVFSRFRSAYREIDNKIVLRGSPSDLPDEEESQIATLLQARKANIGAVLLNSLKDGPLFRAAYSLYKEAYGTNEEVVAILAMTDAMQKHTDWLLKDRGPDGKFPPFILILNEAEAHRFATLLGEECEPFVHEGGLPDIRNFAKIALTLLRQFDIGKAPRIYVTLGPRGSLGVDGTSNVVYVSSFARRGATIYDTNACGDAYCAAISMLEWAKRQKDPSSHKHPNIADVDFGRNQHPGAEEMRYFMAVATAAAYCKATNRRGRVYSADVKDLLQHNHLASVVLPSVTELAKLEQHRRPDCVDENFRLREPAEARYIGVTEELSRLIS